MPEWVDQASKKHLRNPEHIAVTPSGAEQETIEHIAYDVPSGGKLDALKDLMDNRGDGQMIVFGRTKHGVKKLAKQLVAAGYPVAALQGNLSQNARDQVMADFRAGKVQILLATNVAARGIDVSAVDHVINYELPESAELLQHRIGRTGRMGRTGSAITLLSDDDAAKWRQLERGSGKRITRKPWTGARRVDSAPKVVTHTASENRTSANGRSPVGADGNLPAARSERAPRQERQPRSSVGTHGNASAPRPERQPRQEREPRPAVAANGTTAPSERPARRERVRIPRPPVGSQPIMPDLTSISVVSQLIAEQRGYVPQPVAPVIDPSLFEDVDDDQATVQPNVNATRRPNWASQPRSSMSDRIDRESGERHRPSSPSHRRKRDGRGSVNGAPTGENRKARTENRSREQHTATCTSCGRTATLNFAPDLSRPIYCDACFKTRSENRRPTRRTSV
jgi:CxxC-x17-CxxC domain-containing protein